MSDSRSAFIFMNNVRRLREIHDYRLSEVAEFMNTSESTVSRLETGIVWPKAWMLDKLADLYKISIADLFTPAGAGEKAFSLAATKQHAIDAVNRYIAAGELRLVEKKK